MVDKITTVPKLGKRIGRLDDQDIVRLRSARIRCDATSVSSRNSAMLTLQQEERAILSKPGPDDIGVHDPP